jgi:hypothetical protein
LDLVPHLHRHLPLPLRTDYSDSAGRIGAITHSSCGSEWGQGVDVVAQLEKLADAHKEKLNWKTSIVDLMKLLGLTAV